LFVTVAAVWPWKRVIYANLHPSVDKYKPFIVDSGSHLPLFFFAEMVPALSRGHPHTPALLVVADLNCAMFDINLFITVIRVKSCPDCLVGIDKK